MGCVSGGVVRLCTAGLRLIRFGTNQSRSERLLVVNGELCGCV